MSALHTVVGAVLIDGERSTGSRLAASTRIVASCDPAALDDRAIAAS